MSASSFVTEVLTSAGHLEKEELTSKLSVFSKKTEELKAEVYDALQKKYAEFYPNLMSAIDLSARVDLLSKEMNTVTNKVEKEIKAQLSVSSTEFQDLSTQLEEATAVQSVLTRLVAIDSALQTCENALKNRAYLEATKSMKDMKAALSQSGDSRDNEIKILQVLHKRYKTQCEKLETDIAKAWSDLVKWDVTRDEGEANKVHSGITVILTISASDRKETTTGLLQAMSDLGILDTKLKVFGERFLEYIVDPVLTYKDINIKIDTSETDFVFSVQGKKNEKKSEEASILPETALGHLSTAFEFIYTKLFKQSVMESNLEISLMKKLGSHIHQSFIYDHVINNCLKQSIPTNSKDLDEYSKTIALTEGFQNFLIKLELLPEGDSSLADFVNNVNVLFANKKCQELLHQARCLMQSEIHNMIRISPESSDSLPPLGLEGTSAKKSKMVENAALNLKDNRLSSDTFKLPECNISESTSRLLDLAYTTLAEATSGDSTEPCAIQLFYSVRYVFLLFCEVVPTYHKHSLETLPQVTALHHNNCMYLAHHALTLGHQFRPRLPAPLSDGAASFVDLVPRLRRLGTEAFLRQLGKQRDAMLETLSGTQGLVAVSEDDSFRRSERAIKQVLHQLQRLSNVWVEVLPSNIYNKSVGTLLNSVIVDIISKVTSLEDISADDANKLHTLLSIITSRAGELYAGPEGTQGTTEGNPGTTALLHTHVRKYAKYSELLWLLNAGLQEIADRWADGKGPLAAEFSPNEVKQLIRAVFQNTEKRSRVLASIK